MKSTMGIILTECKNYDLKELSSVRPVASVPFGGKYRAIDFALSSMVNSGIINISVITKYNMRSLMDHLGSGKEWDLDRKNRGLFILPASEHPTESCDDILGPLYGNISFLEKSSEKYVLIIQGFAIYNMDFTPMIIQHIETNADITIACRDMSDFSLDERKLLGTVITGENGIITQYSENTQDTGYSFGPMGIFLLGREFLIDLLKGRISKPAETFNDIIAQNAGNLRIYACNFHGYWRPLSNIQLYYRTNMELLNPGVRQELLMNERKIYTKIKDDPPAKYNGDACVRNSIVAEGCIIEGTVENSILFRGVRVEKGAKIKDSLIMQESVIEKNADLQYCILDKEVTVSQGRTLKGEPQYPLVISKKTRV